MPSNAQPSPSEREYDDLTPRQREVYALMAQGLSNAGIARRLVVEEPCVVKHVGEIFWKLGLFPGADPDRNRRVLAVLKFVEADRAA